MIAYWKFKFVFSFIFPELISIEFNFQRKHTAAYEMYLSQKDATKNKKKSEIRKQTSSKHGMSQDCFDKMVIRYIIDGIQPLRTVEDGSFKELVFGKYICIC